MNFGNAHLFWLLGFIPGMYLLYSFSGSYREKLLQQFADQNLLGSLFADEQKRRSRARRDLLVSLAVVSLIVFALLRPQWGFTWSESKRSGVDIVVAVDVSESMLSADISPSRLERARREIHDLTASLKGDRVALVSFAGAAFVETPLTLDYGAFRLFLDSLSTELIPVQGTNIEEALDKSIALFKKDSIERGKNVETLSKRARAVLLITDGENFEGDFARITEKAKDSDIRIYVLGIGSSEGAPIPKKGGYKKDKEGRVVITRLNESALIELAQQTGGIYVKSISSDKDTLAIYDLGIRKDLEGNTLEWGRSKRWNEYFQLPLLLALLLLIFGPWGKLVEIFRARSATAQDEVKQMRTAANLTLLLGSFLFFANPEALRADDLLQGDERWGKDATEHFEDGNFEEAEKKFEFGKLRWKNDYRFSQGYGSALYRLKKYHQAKAAFFEAANRSEDPLIKAEALYNAGNSMVQLGELREAIKTYEESLKLNPEDQETKDNLAFAKRLLEEQKKQQDNQEKQEQNKSDNQEKKDQEQQSQQKSQQNKDQNKENSREQQSQEQDKPQESDEQNSQQDKQEQKEEQNEKESEKKEQQSEDTKQQEEKQQSSASQSQAEEEQQQDYSAVESVLDSIEENRNSLMQYRMKKGLKAKGDKRKKIEKDW